MNLLMWLIFGALVGWIASLVMETDGDQGALANIAVGTIGAFIGGSISGQIGGQGITGFNFRSLIIAVLGSILLLFVLNIFAGNRHGSSL